MLVRTSSLATLGILLAAGAALVQREVDAPREPAAPIATIATSIPLSSPVAMDDAMGRAHVAALPSTVHVDVAAPPSDRFAAGDVAYWRSHHSIVVFHGDLTDAPQGDLVPIGSVTAGLDALAGCARDCPVTVVATG